MNSNKFFYLQNKLEKTHFNLVKKSLDFIKKQYKKPIHEKDNPDLFISLIEETYYSHKKKQDNNEVIEKILKKMKTKRYIEDYSVNREIFNLIILPWQSNKGYFTVLHLETLESPTRDLLIDYFTFIKKELTSYIITSIQILDLTPLLSHENQKQLIKKIQRLKYNNNIDLWKLRKSLDSNVEIETTTQISLEAKHIFLTVQLILIKNTLEAETYEEIFFFRNLLTDFLFLSKFTS